MSNVTASTQKPGSIDLLQRGAFGELQVANLLSVVHVHFPYNINAAQVNTSTTGSGTVTHSDHHALCSTTAASSSSARLETVELIDYHTGIGIDARYTANFTTGVAGSTQLAGIGDATDALAFGYNGATFGILHRNNTSDTWIAQTSWNQDTMDGNGPSGLTLDPTKGNVYRVSYQWLGYGAMSFYVEHPDYGQFYLVHRISYANQNTTVSTSNPTFPMFIEATNTTNDTNIVVKTASLGGFIEGRETSAGTIRFAQSATKSITTEENVLTIRNKSTYQSVTNKVKIRPDFVTLAADGTKNVTVNVYANATLGGSPSYTDISTNTSVVDYDTAGTTVTGGQLVASFVLSKTGSLTQSFQEFNFILYPGQTMTWAAVSTASNDVSVALAWAELFR